MVKREKFDKVEDWDSHLVHIVVLHKKVVQCLARLLLDCLQEEQLELKREMEIRVKIELVL